MKIEIITLISDIPKDDMRWTHLGCASSAVPVRVISHDKRESLKGERHSASSGQPATIETHLHCQKIPYSGSFL